MSVTPQWMQQTIEQRLAAWRTVEAERHNATGRRSPTVLTVSRQAGSGGKLLAARVAEAMGLRYYDRAIIRRVAQMACADPAAVRRRDERSYSSIESWTDVLRSRRTVWTEQDGERNDLRPEDYLRYLVATVGEIADGEGGVILGRGAGFVLSPSQCLRVRVVAPPQQRAENIAAALGASRDRAKSLIAQRDGDRLRFIKQSFGRDLTDPLHYDLVLNTGALGLDECVALVLCAWRSIGERPVCAASAPAERES